MPASAAYLSSLAMLVSCALALRAPAQQQPAAQPPTAEPAPPQEVPAEDPLGASPEDLGRQLEGAGERQQGLLGFDPLVPIVPRWLELKTALRDTIGLDLGLAYTALYQKATDSLGRDEAGGGDFDFFGEWRLLGDEPQNAGLLGFATEQRHAYTALAPRELGAEIGSLWPTTAGFSEQDYALTQIWWQHHLFGDAIAYRVGKIDLDTMFDAYAFRSANYFFANPLFSANVSLVPPSEGLGGAVRWRPVESVHVQAGLGDANGDRTSLEFESFFDQHEYFTTAEVGFTPRIGPRETALYQATLWYVDEREQIGQPSGYGVALTFQHQLQDFVPFFRYAYADAAAGTVFAGQSGSAGFGLHEPFGRQDDVFGFAIGGGEQPDGSRWQVATEAFYCLQLTPYIQVTPSVQGIFNPIDAPDTDALGLLGIRVRVVL